VLYTQFLVINLDRFQQNLFHTLELKFEFYIKNIFLGKQKEFRIFVNRPLKDLNHDEFDQYVLKVLPYSQILIHSKDMKFYQP